MKKIILSTIAYFFINNIFACDYFNNRIENNSHLYMGKKSKIYDAYKQGKCILDDVLKPLQKPSLLTKMKFDLSSVKLDSVFIIFLLLEAEASNLDKYSILPSFSTWVSSYKFNSLTSLASKSLSGSALNSSSGVFFVVSTHFSIRVFKLSCNKFDEDIDDFSLEFDQDLEEKVNDVIDVDEEDVETSVSEEIVQEMDNSASGRLASLRDELDEDNIIEKRPLKDRMDDFFNS